MLKIVKINQYKQSFRLFVYIRHNEQGYIFKYFNGLYLY